MRKVVRGAIALVSAAAVMAVTATSALAEGYGNVAGEETGGNSGGNLPFTGSDLLLYVVVGVAVIATGFGLRALSARRSLS
jgi:hypothetical protein